MPAMRYALNAKEEVVLRSMPSPVADDKTGELKNLEEIAKRAFGDQKRGSAPKSKGNSWVRNSMRKLMRLGLVVHAPGKSGKYARTRVTLQEISDKEEARKASAKKQGDAAKPRTKAGKAAKVAKKRRSAEAQKQEKKSAKKAEKADDEVQAAEAAGA
jgi:hypothetical protein